MRPDAPTSAVAPLTPPRVAVVEAWLVEVPLERPVRFERDLWTVWRHVVVRLQTEDGLEAAAYGLIGDIPLDVMVCELIAPRVVGVDIPDLRAFGESCTLAAGPPLVDLVRPAASLVEACLWDLVAQQAGVPLWKLLSAKPRERVPVMHVEHRRDGDTTEAFAARVVSLAAGGVRAVKIKHYGDVAETAARLATVRAAAPGDLEIVVDPASPWDDVGAAVAAVRAWERFGLAWVEDPFAPHRVEDAAQLRAAVDTPIGIGDLITSVDLAERLIRGGAVDVLRVDVTTLGGIAGVERLTALAASAGVDVSPELLPELHQHLAFAWPTVRAIEIYSPESGVWGAGAFVRPGALTFADAGHVVAPERPGSGLEVDIEALDRTAIRFSRSSAGDT